MSKKIKVPIFQIIQILIPIIRNFTATVKVAREADSEGGRKITRDEWQDLVLELLVLQAGPEITTALINANEHLE
tara:strand:+ start:239 stop:463 length:225 start_codon:yes stop_codon:yes gene_type:complete